MASWTKENLKHTVGLLKQGRNPAATVYDSIGPDFFLALAPGWLNLGLWEGPGDPEEAPAAARRLVATIAAAHPKHADALDVGHGHDPPKLVPSEVAETRNLVAPHISDPQL